MVLTSELPNLEDVARAKLLLYLADPALLSKDASHASKRKHQLLITTASKGQQIPTLDTTEEHTHQLFVASYQRALRLVRSFERFPVPMYLATEQTTYRHGVFSTDAFRERRNDLAETIAIMLDSCSPQELTDLTTTFGRAALGDYAREYGQPFSH